MSSRLLVIALLGLVSLLVGCAGSMKTHRHDLGIYGNDATAPVYVPFEMRVEPMERLLLVNIEKDPDTHYIGFEPQVFDDDVTGTGNLVIAYRHDGYVDVYHEPSISVDHLDYSIVGKGLGEMTRTEFERFRFDVQPHGLDVEVAFVDRFGRSIRVMIAEDEKRARRPFDMLAPLGSSTASPPSLPLILLFDFYFVRRKGTQYQILVDGRSHRLDRLPFPIDGSRMYFTRYAADPFIVQFNPGYDGMLEAVEATQGAAAEWRGSRLELVRNGPYVEIASMTAGDGQRDMVASFDPPLPQLAAMRDGASVTGSFVLMTQASMGDISGTYSFRRQGDVILATLRPGGGWDAQPDRGSLRMLFFVARPFKNWPKTYAWEATIRLGEPATMQSGWTRTK
jgi:hypothetical protein